MKPPLRILLVQPPFEDFYATPIRLYPLGLLYAAQTLRVLGCEVHVLDGLSPLRKRELPVPPRFSYLRPWIGLPEFFRGYYRYGLPDEEILGHVRALAPDAVGISSLFTAYFSSAARLAGLIKRELGLPVFVGGHHPTVFAREILRRFPEIDAALVGPAEACLPGFLERLRPGESFPTPDWRELVPAHDLIDAGRYRIGRHRAMSLSAGRGCPHNCLFCGVDKMFGHTLVYRTPESVLAEMRRAALERRVGVLNFEDDNLSNNRAWFLSLLAAVRDEACLKGVELTAMNGLCASDLDEETLIAMRGAGFERLNLSLVTQDRTLRDSLDRPRGRHEFKELVESAGSLGFKITAYIILGLPGQTAREIEDSVDELLGLGVLVGPSVYYPAPGSMLYDRPDVRDEIKSDWDMHRSSAFSVETEHLSRADLVNAFLMIRRKNLQRRSGSAANSSASGS